MISTSRNKSKMKKKCFALDRKMVSTSRNKQKIKKYCFYCIEKWFPLGGIDKK